MIAEEFHNKIKKHFPYLPDAAGVVNYPFFRGLKKIANHVGYEGDLGMVSDREKLDKFWDYLWANRELYSWWIL